MKSKEVKDTIIIQIWKKTCVDKVIDVVQLLVQSDGETYCCCSNLLAHMIEKIAKYVQIYETFLVYLIRKKKISCKKN